MCDTELLTVFTEKEKHFLLYTLSVPVTKTFLKGMHTHGIFSQGRQLLSLQFVYPCRVYSSNKFFLFQANVTKTFLI